MISRAEMAFAVSKCDCNSNELSAGADVVLLTHSNTTNLNQSRNVVFAAAVCAVQRRLVALSGPRTEAHQQKISPASYE